MRKTLLRISLFGFVAAALLVASCESPTSFDVSYGDIGSVQNLKVKPYTGVNLLTWDPIASAGGYEVYRREKAAGQEDWSEYRSLNTNVSDIRYPDIIGDANVLKDDSEYTYKVIAKSDTAVLSSSSTEVSYKTDTAAFPNKQFPAKGTALGVTITAPAITVDNVLGIATLTWTASGDIPAIWYKVSKTSPSSGSSWNVIRETTTATVNINGDGFVDAQIIVGLTDNSGNLINYYTPSAPVYVNPVAYNVQHLDSISGVSLNASRVGQTNQVVITYTEVEEATAYILQKAKSNSVGASLSWAEVATTGAVDLGTQLQVTDTIDADAWQYRLFVRTANGISTAIIGSPPISQASIGNPQLSNPTSEAASIDGNLADGLDTARNRLKVTLNSPEAGVAYQLYVRKIGDANGTGSDIGEWAATGSSLTSVAENVPLTFYYNPANAQRQQYQFAVRGTKEGYADSFSSSTNSIAAKSQFSLWANISGNDLILNGVTSLQANESIKVYVRKNTTANGITTPGNYTLVHTFVAPTAGGPLVITKDIGSAGTNSSWDSSNVRCEVVIN